MFVLKFHYNGETHRVSYTKATPPAFSNLEQHIREVFGDSITRELPFKFTYLDDESDTVSISCDHDLTEALSFHFKTGRDSLRLEVVLLDKSRERIRSTNEAIKPEQISVEAQKVREEWAKRISLIRGKFQGLVDACHKLGVTIQKKMEDRKSVEPVSETEPAPRDTEPKVPEGEGVSPIEAVPQAVEDCQPEENPQPEVEEGEEKEKNPESLEPKVTVEVCSAPIVHVRNEYEAMLSMYELTEEDREVLLNATKKPRTVSVFSWW